MGHFRPPSRACCCRVCTKSSAELIELLEDALQPQQGIFPRSHGNQWIINGYQWLSMVINGYQWWIINGGFMGIHGYWWWEKSWLFEGYWPGEVIVVEAMAHFPNCHVTLPDGNRNSKKHIVGIMGTWGLPVVFWRLDGGFHGNLGRFISPIVSGKIW